MSLAGFVALVLKYHIVLMLLPLKAVAQFVLFKYFKKEVVLLVKWVVRKFTPVYHVEDRPLAYSMLQNPLFEAIKYSIATSNTDP